MDIITITNDNTFIKNKNVNMIKYILNLLFNDWSRAYTNCFYRLCVHDSSLFEYLSDKEKRGRKAIWLEEEATRVK